MSGVYLYSAGQNPFTNAGRIAGGAYGVKTADIAGLAWDVTNAAAGLITEAADTGVGVSLVSGVFTNEGRVIAHGGQAIGVYLHDAALVNDGMIRASQAIEAGTHASVGSYNRTTITNAGTIIGTGPDAIVFKTSSDLNWGRLVLDTGSVIQGDVVWEAASGGVAGRIELAAQGSLGVGVISGLGTQYQGFGSLQVDAGAQWRIEGQNVFPDLPTIGLIALDAGLATIARAGALAAESLEIEGAFARQTGRNRFAVAGSMSVSDTLFLRFCTLSVASQGVLQIGDGAGARAGVVDIMSDGTVAQFGGVLSTSVVDDGMLSFNAERATVTGSISGSGQVLLDPLSRGLTVEGGLSVASVRFVSPTGGALALGSPARCRSVISGFGGRNTIDLLGAQATSASWSAGVLTVRDNGVVVSRLHFAGTYSGANFALAADGAGGTIVSFVRPAGEAPAPEGPDAGAHRFVAAMAAMGVKAGPSLHLTASRLERPALLAAPRPVQ